VILKREGQGIASYEGAHDVALIKRDGKQYRVTEERGDAHWIAKAVSNVGWS
jgi:hypothetical protein